MICTGEETYKIRGEHAMLKMKEWSRHSDWNFKNKLLLIEAEYYNTQKDYDKAAQCYEASTKAAQEHKFYQEEAIANELAGIFFLKRRNFLKSYSSLMRAMECYEKWGAHACARRIEDDMRSKYGSELLQFWSFDHPVTLPAVESEGYPSKKRQLSD